MDSQAPAPLLQPKSGPVKGQEKAKGKKGKDGGLFESAIVARWNKGALRAAG